MRALIIHKVYFSTNVLPSNTAAMYNREGACNSRYVGGSLCSGDKQFVVQEVTIYCLMEMRKDFYIWIKYCHALYVLRIRMLLRLTTMLLVQLLHIGRVHVILT